VDPHQAGLANKADVWLRVRSGTDGALALGLANPMIERNWYDRDFVRRWSNGPRHSISTGSSSAAEISSADTGVRWTISLTIFSASPEIREFGN